MQKTILDSVKYVVDNSIYVKINEDKVKSFVESFQIGEQVHWLHYAPFNIFELPLKQQVDLITIMSSISFSYWGAPKWTIEYKGQKYDGAYGLFAAFGKAIENGYPILEASYLSHISEEDFDKILEGNIRIPLFYERLNILREVGMVLNEKFNNNFLSIVEKISTGSNLLEIIIDSFPCLADVSIYNNEKVLFYKKAQLLTSDILQLIPKSQEGSKLFSSLTGCADYKLAQVLRGHGLLEYNEQLANIVDKKIELNKDSKEENEIRANTIWVIELIKDRMKCRMSNIDSMTINNQIWLLSQDNKDMKPYHLVRTTAY